MPDTDDATRARRPEPQEARLPGANARLGVMILLAATAVFLTMQPSPPDAESGEELIEALRAVTADDESDQSSTSTGQTPGDSSTPPGALASVDEQPEEPSGDNTGDSEAEETAQAVENPEPETQEASAEESPSEEPQAPLEGDPDEESSTGGGLEEDASLWEPMTGSWDVDDGQLLQTNPDGFDYINIYTGDVPESFAVAVRMQATGSELGGGIILAQTTTGSRKGAYIVDFTAGGEFLRWGRYDETTGEYTYIGGLNVGTDAADPQTIKIEVKSDTTLVYLDDAYIGAFEALDGSGRVGLATSQSSVAFDEFTIEEL